MRVVATSDIHGTLPTIPECDLLLVGGDICPDYVKSRTTGITADRERWDKGEQRQRHWLANNFRRWLEEVPAKHIVGIAGNHDFVFEHRFLVSPLELPWVYLQDSWAEVAGVRIYGLPWVPNLPFWAFHARDEVLDHAYDAVEECDILLSHGPPLNIGDEAPSKYGSREGEHVGAPGAIRAIERAKPRFYVCGHIHEGYGEYDHKGTTVLNVAHNNGIYEPVNPPVEFDI